MGAKLAKLSDTARRSTVLRITRNHVVDEPHGSRSTFSGCDASH